jgi:hypothetical protein
MVVRVQRCVVAWLHGLCLVYCVFCGEALMHGCGNVVSHRRFGTLQ